MIYITDDRRDETCDYTAGNKAINDVADILYEREAQPFKPKDSAFDNKYSNLFNQIKYQFTALKNWKEELDKLNKNDKLIIQYPFIHNQTVFFKQVINYARKRGIVVILFLHDVDSLRASDNPDANIIHQLNLFITEKTALRKADFIIAHNNRMAELIRTQLKYEAKRLIPLNIFDYLAPNETPKRNARTDVVVIAGNLLRAKAGYIYSLPAAPLFNLYGINAEADRLPNNANYKGIFNPNDGPNIIEGSWGLVWDGDSIDVCSGTYGAYLKINNPHKASLYLAAGLPLIVWDQSALASYVLGNKLGVTVSSLNEIDGILEKITEADYVEMKKNALQQSKMLRSGYNTIQAIVKIGEQSNDKELLKLANKNKHDSSY